MRGWKMQVGILRTQLRDRRGGKRKYEIAGLKYASTENIHCITCVYSEYSLWRL